MNNREKPVGETVDPSDRGGGCIGRPNGLKAHWLGRSFMMPTSRSIQFYCSFQIRARASLEIPRIANAIGNAAAQSSAMTQNARGPSAP